MDSESSLLNESVNRLLTQLFTNGTFLSFEDIVAQALAKIFHRFVLTFTDLSGEGIIKLRKMFLLNLVESNLEIGFLTGQLLISIIGRDSSRERLCFAGLHTNNMSIHTGE